MITFKDERKYVTEISIEMQSWNKDAVLLWEMVVILRAYCNYWKTFTNKI